MFKARHDCKSGATASQRHMAARYPALGSQTRAQGQPFASNRQARELLGWYQRLHSKIKIIFVMTTEGNFSLVSICIFLLCI